MMSPNPDMPGNGPQMTIDETSSKQINFSPRIPSLDVFRGLAVLAGLFISIWIFGGFSQNAQNGLLLSSKGFDYRLFGTVDLLLDGKMRALIAIVFGAGMLLFLSKDNQKGELPTHDLFIRRQMWLIAFGIVNGLIFLWTGDILFHLGIMGILLFPFVRLSAKGLLIAAVLVTFIYSGKNYWQYADDKKAYSKYLAVTEVEKKIAKDTLNKSKAVTPAINKKDTASKKDTLTKQQVQDKGAWEGMVAGMKYDPKKDDGDKTAMRKTSYGSLYNYLMPTLQSRQAQWTYQKGIWDFAGMIFLGMALFKLGFFTGRFSKGRYLLIALCGLTAGLLLGWFRLHYQQHTLHDYAKYINAHWLPYSFFFPFERAFMTLGYVGSIMFLMNAGLFKILWRGLANVGRLALTNYLAQTLMCSLFFTGFGTGYFGRLDQYQLYLFALEICIGQIIFSTLWLRVYHIGPAEWLWRCLTYGKRLPFLKRKREPVEPTITALS